MLGALGRRYISTNCYTLTPHDALAQRSVEYAHNCRHDADRSVSRSVPSSTWLEIGKPPCHPHRERGDSNNVWEGAKHNLNGVGRGLTVAASIHNTHTQTDRQTLHA